MRIEAAPINPSDLGLLLGPRRHLDAAQSGRRAADAPRRCPSRRWRTWPRGSISRCAVGNEGAGDGRRGRRERAGAARQDASRCCGGAMYAQYRVLPAHEVPARCPTASRRTQGASAFVNPMTALCMLETMRREGHTALVHTAAASNLGQMLGKVCRRTASRSSTSCAAPSRSRCCRSSARSTCSTRTSPTFAADLAEARRRDRRHARVRRDRRRHAREPDPDRDGGRGARSATTYSRYGSAMHKQVYIYGTLDLRPTELDRTLRPRVGRRRLARDRRSSRSSAPEVARAARARARRADDDVREPLHRDDLAARGDRSPT